MNKRITIVIPAYNGEKWIVSAVKSALSQVITGKDGLQELYEVIVRDDCSTDKTVEVLKKIKDSRLRIVKGKKRLGLVGNFQASFDLVTTPFVTILGQDDLIDTNYLKLVMDEFKDDVAMVACHPRFINGDGTPFNNPDDARVKIPKPKNMTREEFLAVFRQGNMYFGINTYKTEVVKEVGGFDEKVGWLLDQDLYIRIVQKYSIHIIESELCSLGLREDTTSNLTYDKVPQQHAYLRRIRQKNFTPTKLKVIFATPFYMSQEFSHFGESMIHTCHMLTQAGIEWDLIRINGDSYVDRAKNTIIANFLETDGTDLIMIDSDEQWHPSAISRLLQHEEEIVTASYPFKNRWGEFAGNPLMKINDKGEKEYAGYRPLSDGSYLLEAYNVSGGFMRLKRSALEKYADAYPNDIYIDDCAWPGRPGRTYTTYFMCDVINFQRYGEDAYFGRRMKEIGIKLWIDTNIDIVHYGVKGWSGNLHKHLLRPADEIEKLQAKIDAENKSALERIEKEKSASGEQK